MPQNVQTCTLLKGKIDMKLYRVEGLKGHRRIGLLWEPKQHSWRRVEWDGWILVEKVLPFAFTDAWGRYILFRLAEDTPMILFSRHERSASFP